MASGPVVVIGSAVVDQAFRVEALPLPGESAIASEVHQSLGGKGANQAAAARMFGAPTVFIGRVGDDWGGRETAEDLERRGIDSHLTTTPGAPTGHAAVVVDEEGENQIAVHPGANALLTVEDVEACRDVLASASVYVAQLEVPLDVVRAAADLTRENEDAVRVLNAAPSHSEAGELVSTFDVVVVNRVEAELMVGVAVTSLDDAKAALRGIQGLGVADPVVTLGSAGALCLDRGRPLHVRAPEVETLDTTGTGDAFVGALAALLREEVEMCEAVEAACKYAALAATRAGTRDAYVDRATFEAAFPEE